MMSTKKWIVAYLTMCIIFVISPLFSQAKDEQYQNVMVVYNDDDGKKQVLKQATKTEHTYENLHTIEGTFSKEAINSLKKTSGIKVVEKNPVTLQIENTSSSILTTITPNWNINAVNAQKAWASGLTGQNVKVAVIDTGVAINSSLPNVKRYSFVDDNPTTRIDESSPYDIDGHGTFVSGIIAASLTSSQLYGNIVGIAPDATIYSLKVFEKDGASMESILKALEWSIENKIDIVNMSLGTPDDDPILKNAIQAAYNAGLTIVAAAGNDGIGKNVEYPARYDDVIAVSSVDRSNQISYFSNTGSKVEFTAPGSDIYSLGINGKYEKGSGTSFAAPHVTGILALLTQQYPDYNNEKLRKVLRNYTIDLGSKGKDPYYGYGLVNYNLTTPDDVQKLEVHNITENSAMISFAPKEKSIIPSEKYNIYINNKRIATTTGHDYTFTNLKEGTTYKVLVESVSANNIASAGKDIAFTTIKPTVEEQYIKKYRNTITSWISRVEKGQSLTFQTQFSYLYSIREGLSKSQKKLLSNYNKKIKLVIISSTSTSSYVKASNLKSLKSKKTTTITFGTALKTKTLTTSKVSIIHAGKKITGFKLKKDTKGKTIKLSTTKTLAKGNYVIFINNKGVKTSKGKQLSRPIAIEYVLK